MDSKLIKVLVVEDDLSYAKVIERMLIKLGVDSFDIKYAVTFSDALNRMTGGDIDVVLLDLGLPDSEGLDTFHRFREAIPGVPVIIVTGLDDEDIAIRAIHEGAQYYLVKGELDGNVLVRAILYAMERHQAKQELQRAYDELEMRVDERTAELSKAIQELRRSREQLRNLSAYLQDVREQERTAVSREIHDELGQGLTGIKMDLSWLKKRLPGDDEALMGKTASMMGLIDNSIQLTKRIISQLRPPLLDDLGLEAATEWQAEEFQKRTGIQCELNIDPEEIHLDKDISTALFRIFQEALTNIVRHADATKVKVEMQQGEEGLTLMIRDNGRGIRKDRIFGSESFGLMGMRERVYQFGGEFNIKGVEGKGTTVTVRIPIKK